MNVLLVGLNAALPKELHIGLLPEGTSAISSYHPAWKGQFDKSAGLGFVG